MDSGKSKTSDVYRLMPIVSDKTDLNQCEKYVALFNLFIYYTRKKQNIT